MNVLSCLHKGMMFSIELGKNVSFDDRVTYRVTKDDVTYQVSREDFEAIFRFKDRT